VEDEAVSQDQHKVTRNELIDLLNEDLAREYQAIISYVVYSQVLLRLLRAIPDSPIVRQGLADQPSDSTCGDGQNRGDPTSWRTPSSL
jgi:hypothetical protein